MRVAPGLADDRENSVWRHEVDDFRLLATVKLQNFNYSGNTGDGGLVSLKDIPSWVEAILRPGHQIWDYSSSAQVEGEPDGKPILWGGEFPNGIFRGSHIYT